MNSKKVNKAIEAAFKKSMAMPEDQLRQELEKHKNGDIAKMLLYSGFFEAREME